MFDELSPLQLKALPLIACGISSKDVAQTVGVSAQTVSEWLNHDDEFRAGLAIIKRDALQAARSELQCAALEAVQTVLKVMRESKSEQMQLKAAQMILCGLVPWGKAGADHSDVALPPSDPYGFQLSVAKGNHRHG